MNDTFMKEKPVFPLLVSMALPMVISMLVNSLYNIVDSFFVAKISEDAMTALSLVFPVQNLINSIAVGFGVGINAVIAFHLGAKQQETADRAATQGFVLSAVHGVVVMVVSIAAMPMFLRMFTSAASVLQLGLRYSRIAFAFSPFIMLSISFEKVFQSVGWMKTSMLGMMLGCVTNIVLDPLLIFGVGFFPELGIDGAAIATGIGQIVSLVFYLAVYAVKTLPVRVRAAYRKPDKALALRLYAIGIPATLNMALPSLLISCLNALLSLYAQSYVVVLGIYYKLQTFLYMPANGIVQGMRPVIGYNFGARERLRVQKIYRITLAMCGAIMAAGTIVCLTASGQLIGLFSGNAQTIAEGQTALRIISAGFLVSAASVTSCGALEGLGKGVQSLVISLCRYVIIILPVAFVLSRFWGSTGVWNAFWIAEAATAVIAVLVYRKAVREKE